MSDAPPEVEVEVDPAEASAAGDPLPGKRKRPMNQRQKDAMARGRATALANRRAKAAAKSKTAAPSRVGPTDRQLAEAVANFYALLGMGIGVADAELGQAVALCSDPAGQAWVHVSQQSPAVRRVLVSTAGTGAVAELIFAHSPLFALVLRRLNVDTTALQPEAPPPPNGQGSWAPAPGYVG